MPNYASYLTLNATLNETIKFVFRRLIYTEYKSDLKCGETTDCRYAKTAKLGKQRKISRWVKPLTVYTRVKHAGGW